MRSLPAMNMKLATLAVLLSVGTELSAGTRIVIQPIFSVTWMDLFQQTIPGARVAGFDISQDGNVLAVAFEVIGPGRVESCWIAEWALPNGQLLRKAAIDQLTEEERSHAFDHFHRQTRFTPDGRKLVVGTGPRIQIVSVETLRVLASIQPSVVNSPSRSGPVISNFQVSLDGNAIGVFTTGVPFEDAEVAFALWDLNSGTKRAEWHIPRTCNLGGYFYGFEQAALSPEGDALLVIERDCDDKFQDLRLFDAHTGATEKRISLDGGDPSHSPASIFFVAGAKVVAVAPDNSGPYSSRALLLVLNKEGVTLSRSPELIGWYGDVAISPTSPAVLLTHFWPTKNPLNHLMEFPHTVEDLVEYDSSTNQINRIPLKQRLGSPSTASKASLFACFTGNQSNPTVAVYRLVTVNP